MNIQVVRTPQETAAAFELLSIAACLGCDTETSALSSRYGKLFSIQFSDGDHNVLVPLSEGVELGELAVILADPAIVKIFHNSRFDLDFLGQAGITVRNVFDTMIAEKVLTRGANQSASLAETLYRYFAIDLNKTQRKAFNRTWNGIWTEELIEYALSDVVHLPNLMREQTLWMERLDLTDEFETEMARTNAACS